MGTRGWPGPPGIEPLNQEPKNRNCKTFSKMVASLCQTHSCPFFWPFFSPRKKKILWTAKQTRDSLGLSLFRHKLRPHQCAGKTGSERSGKEKRNSPRSDGQVSQFRTPRRTHFPAAVRAFLRSPFMVAAKPLLMACTVRPAPHA